MTSVDRLEAFASALPDIQIFKQGDVAYESRKRVYNAAVAKNPLAIAEPKSAEEVASIVKFAKRTGTQLSIRSGGHDLFGRSLVDGALTIDLRALDQVLVDKQAGVATLGGGVLSKQLSKALAEHGCLTPCPNIASVGYIGYALTGGYGQMVHKMGLGVDHLLAAKIVDANGEIVDADENVMRAIRGAGAGGSFGIIVSATIKIYPFSRFLAGIVIYESTNLETTMDAVRKGLDRLSETIPPELDFQPFCSYIPMGKVYGGMFMWASPDIERGREYLREITSFHPVVVNTVDEATMQESLERNAPYVPERSYMNSRSVSVRTITPKIWQILVNASARMPQDLAAMLTWHEARATSPSFHAQTSLPSVFNAREPHFVIEILANAVKEENFSTVSNWGLALRDELLREDPEQILDAPWLASTPSDEFELEKLYGVQNADFLIKLKKSVDPEGLFKHGLFDLS